MLRRSISIGSATPTPHTQRARDYQRVQFLALLGRELLGVMNALDESLGREDDRRRDHRTRHRTDAGLVDARHRLDSATPEFALVAEIRMLGHRAAPPAPLRAHRACADEPIIGAAFN